MFEVISMTTGQRIKAARKTANLTQAELAEKVGVPFQSISQWERDLRNPKKETLEKLADVLGCYYFELYGDDDGREAASLMMEGMRLGANAKVALDRMMILSEYKEKGYQFNDEEVELVAAYNKLNQNGQSIVLTLIKRMVESPDYQSWRPSKNNETVFEEQTVLLETKDTTED